MRAPTPSFEEVYDETAPIVFRALVRLGVPQALVEDVVQEVFCIVHRRLAAFEGRSSVRTWVYGIAVRVARTHRRTTARRPTDGADALDELATDPRHAPDALVEAAEAHRLVLALIDELDETLREVFVLAELEELTAAQIGDVLALSPNTVSSRLRLARRDFQLAHARLRARDEWRLR